MSNAFKLQSAEDIENIIEKHRKSYAPEWKFDKENPDAGTVMAQIFARQIEENNRLMSQMPERYHLEFVNMLDSTLKPAQPAGSMVVFNMDTETLMGTQVPKGTRLSAGSDQSDSGFLIYETDRNLFVTESQIKNVFMTDFERGTLSPIFGDLNTPEIITGNARIMISDDEPEGEEPEDTEALTEEEELEERYRIPPFTLFGETKNVGRSILTLYEQKLFDGIGEPIYIRFEDAEDVIERVQSGAFVFKYFTRKALQSLTRFS